jgi:hypothetical protein
VAEYGLLDWMIFIVVVKAIQIGGIDVLTRVHPGLHKLWRRFAKWCWGLFVSLLRWGSRQLLTFLRWGLGHIGRGLWNGARWFGRWLVTP